jgi:hypothetical protein
MVARSPSKSQFPPNAVSGNMIGCDAALDPRELASNSEYVRRAVIERLRADGIDPARLPLPQSSAA